MTYEDLLLDDEDFPRIGKAFAPHERVGRVACAEARLFPLRKLADFRGRLDGGEPVSALNPVWHARRSA